MASSASCSEEDRKVLLKLMTDMRDDLQKSLASRERLTSLIILMGVIGVALWCTLVYALIQMDRAREENLLNTEIGHDSIQIACEAYLQRVGEESEACLASRFYQPRR